MYVDKSELCGRGAGAYQDDFSIAQDFSCLIIKRGGVINIAQLDDGYESNVKKLGKMCP